MKRFEIVFPATVFAFLGVLLFLGTFVLGYGHIVMRFPYLVGGFTMVMCIIVIAIQVRGGRETGTAATGEAPVMYEEQKIAPRALIGAGLWLLGILPVMWLCGYLVGIPLYLLAYLRAHGESWLLSITISAAMCALIYFVFLKFLLVPLPLMPFTAFD